MSTHLSAVQYMRISHQYDINSPLCRPVHEDQPPVRHQLTSLPSSTWGPTSSTMSTHLSTVKYMRTSLQYDVHSPLYRQVHEDQPPVRCPLTSLPSSTWGPASSTMATHLSTVQYMRTSLQYDVHSPLYRPVHEDQPPVRCLLTSLPSSTWGPASSTMSTHLSTVQYMRTSLQYDVHSPLYRPVHEDQPPVRCPLTSLPSSTWGPASSTMSTHLSTVKYMRTSLQYDVHSPLYRQVHEDQPPVRCSLTFLPSSTWGPASSTMSTHLSTVQYMRTSLQYDVHSPFYRQVHEDQPLVRCPLTSLPSSTWGPASSTMSTHLSTVQYMRTSLQYDVHSSLYRQVHEDQPPVPCPLTSLPSSTWGPASSTMSTHLSTVKYMRTSLQYDVHSPLCRPVHEDQPPVRCPHTSMPSSTWGPASSTMSTHLSAVQYMRTSLQYDVHTPLCRPVHEDQPPVRCPLTSLPSSTWGPASSTMSTHLSAVQYMRTSLQYDVHSPLYRQVHEDQPPVRCPLTSLPSSTWGPASSTMSTHLSTVKYMRTSLQYDVHSPLYRPVHEDQPPVRCPLTSLPSSTWGPASSTMSTHLSTVKYMRTSLQYDVHSPLYRPVHEDHPPVRCPLTSLPSSTWGPASSTMFTHLSTVKYMRTSLLYDVHSPLYRQVHEGQPPLRCPLTSLPSSTWGPASSTMSTHLSTVKYMRTSLQYDVHSPLYRPVHEDQPSVRCPLTSLPSSTWGPASSTMSTHLSAVQYMRTSLQYDVHTPLCRPVHEDQPPVRCPLTSLLSSTWGPASSTMSTHLSAVQYMRTSLQYDVHSPLCRPVHEDQPPVRCPLTSLPSSTWGPASSTMSTQFMSRYLMKPNPRDFPVAWFFITTQSITSPYRLKYFSNVSTNKIKSNYI